MSTANRVLNFKKENIVNKHLNIYVPVSPSVLKFSLIAVFILAVGLASYRILKFGIPLFEQTWYTTGLKSTIGITNKLLFSTGIMSLVIIGLVCFGLYKSQSKRSLKYLTVFFFITYILFQTLNGGKSTAVMPILLIGMAIFYCERKVPRKFLLIAGTLILAMAFYIGTYWTEVFSANKILLLFYDRMTSVAAVHLDYLFYDWAVDHSYQFGETILLEIKRVIAQITLTPKEPLFNEIIGNLKIGDPISKVTGASPEISIFGMGYANFGIVGAILTALTLGFFVQRLNIYMLSQRTLNLFSFVLWVYFMFQLLGVVRAGNVILGLENYFIEIVPALVLISFGYVSLALPFPSTLKFKIVIEL